MNYKWLYLKIQKVAFNFHGRSLCCFLLLDNTEKYLNPVARLKSPQNLTWFHKVQYLVYQTQLLPRDKFLPLHMGYVSINSYYIPQNWG